jgi:hypothetical protein
MAGVCSNIISVYYSIHIASSCIPIIPKLLIILKDFTFNSKLITKLACELQQLLTKFK